MNDWTDFQYGSLTVLFKIPNILFESYRNLFFNLCVVKIEI